MWWRQGSVFIVLLYFITTILTVSDLPNSNRMLPPSPSSSTLSFSIQYSLALLAIFSRFSFNYTTFQLTVHLHFLKLLFNHFPHFVNVFFSCFSRQIQLPFPLLADATFSYSHSITLYEVQQQIDS